MKCPEAGTTFPSLGPDCMDPEACQQGTLCEVVRRVEAASRLSKAEEAIMNKDETIITDDGFATGRIQPDHERLRAQLDDWWSDQSEQEMLACIPKAIEYGSTDLAVIGRTMGRLMGRNGSMTHEEATEIGIFFYLQGKMARWEDAITNGRRVSDDTLFDIAIYLKMQQRNRAVGGWPTAPGEE